MGEFEVWFPPEFQRKCLVLTDFKQNKVGAKKKSNYLVNYFLHLEQFKREKKKKKKRLISTQIQPSK